MFPTFPVGVLSARRTKQEISKIPVIKSGDLNLLDFPTYDDQSWTETGVGRGLLHPAVKHFLHSSRGLEIPLKATMPYPTLN